MSSSSSSSSSSSIAPKETKKKIVRPKTKIAKPQVSKAAELKRFETFWTSYSKKHKEEMLKIFKQHVKDGKESELDGITLEKMIDMQVETARFQQSLQMARNPKQSVFSRWMK
jgi:hypothetical protein